MLLLLDNYDSFTWNVYHFLKSFKVKVQVVRNNKIKASDNNKFEKYKGIKIKMKGNGDEYFLHLRNRSSRLPWQYYHASFKSEPTWKEVNIPFQKFKRSSNFMKSVFDPNTIKTIGIVAYGKDHTADIMVSELQFY